MGRWRPNMVFPLVAHGPTGGIQDLESRLIWISVKSARRLWVASLRRGWGWVDLAEGFTWGLIAADS